MKNEYFEAAVEWSSKRVELLEISANRWQLAFWGMLICLLAVVFALVSLMPLKTLEPIIIQKDLQTGEVFVKPGDPANLVKSQQQTESDCVNYIIARETYSAVDEEVRYRQLQYMSSPDVFESYINERKATNSDSFQALLGENGLRKVVVEDVVFLDASDPKLLPENREKILPVAKIDFVTKETKGQSIKKKYWIATIRFKYLGTPDTKEAAWANWDGFTVTAYRVDQRNV